MKIKHLKLIIFFFIFFKSIPSSAKIVYLDLNKILQDSESGKFIQLKINNLKKVDMQVLNNVKKQLNEEKKKIEIQKNILSNEVYDEKIRKLKKRVILFNSDLKKKENELNKIRSDFTNQLIKELNPIIEKYSIDNNIDFILPKKNVILGKKELDITDEIIFLLNQKLTEIKITE